MICPADMTICSILVIHIQVSEICVKMPVIWSVEYTLLLIICWCVYEHCYNWTWHLCSWAILVVM